jgi:PAS domain S-box-containing protein
MLAAIREGKPVQYLETDRVDPKGRPLSISLALSPIHDQRGVAIGAAIIARDITDSAQAEERFRLAVESSPNAMVMCNPTGSIVLVNEETERLFGYDRNELIGRSIEILVPEQFRGAHPGHRDGFMAQPAARSMGAGRDLYAVRKDGIELPVEIGLNPIDTPDGTFVLAAVVDITERKQAEERFRLAVEASPNGHVMVGQHGDIVMVNAEAERMFGYPRDELIGRSVDVLVPQRFRGQHARHRNTFMMRAAARSMGAGRDLYAVRKDGTEFPVEIGLNPIHAPTGTLVLSAVVDITERKRTEDALARQARELERSNAELEQFAYVASHDLREPLRTIASFTSLLQREYGDQLDEQAATYIGFAVDASQRMQRLISDLLAYARLSTRVEEPTRVDLGAVTAIVLDNLKVSIDESQAEIFVEALPVIDGTESQLVELFQNLIANAIKFRGEEAPKITVGAQRAANGWTLSVSDNGIGIAPEYHEAVFQVFRRLHLRDEYPGTGIGLAFCKQIVERHNGRIWIESSLDRGTTVKIQISTSVDFGQTGKR